jgi:hypothetical protein
VGFTSVLAIIVIGFAISLILERNRARREAETSRRVADFMINMFNVSDPTEARGNTITAREILDKSSKDIETGLNKDPRLRAQLMDVMETCTKGWVSTLALTISSKDRRKCVGKCSVPTTQTLCTRWMASRGCFHVRVILPKRRSCNDRYSKGDVKV